MKPNVSSFILVCAFVVLFGGWYVWQLVSRAKVTESRLEAQKANQIANLQRKVDVSRNLIEILGGRSEALRKDLRDAIATSRQDLNTLARRLDALEEERGDPYTTPLAVVKAFFKAMETDDRKAMTRLMTPERAERMEKPGAWDAWLALWKRFTVVRVGEVLTEKGADGNLPERVKVLVEYREGERTLKDSVTVSRIDGRWYWDEN